MQLSAVVSTRIMFTCLVIMLFVTLLVDSTIGDTCSRSADITLLRRLGKGSGYKGSKLPEKPLVYWGYESSPFCKVSRCLGSAPWLQEPAQTSSHARRVLFTSCWDGCH